MWVFFCVLLVVFVLMFGPFCLELKNKRGRERFFEVSLHFCGLCIYQGVFMLHFKHVVRPQIIKVKKAGFKKIYAAAIQKSKKKRDLGYLFKSKDIRKMDAVLWLGAGDAAHTALICGALNSTARCLIQAYALSMAKVEIRPDYSVQRICLQIHGIVCLSLADIMGRFLKEMRRRIYASYRECIKHHNVRA